MTTLVLVWPDGLNFTDIEAKQNQLEAEHDCQVTGGIAMTRMERVEYIAALDEVLRLAGVATWAMKVRRETASISRVEELRAKIREGLR